MLFSRRYGRIIILVSFVMIAGMVGNVTGIDPYYEINITKVDNGSVLGNVSSIDIALYSVIVFVQNDGKWWGPKPMKGYIDDIDRSWKCTYYTDSTDANDTAIRVYLVPDYLSDAANATGQSEIPTEGWDYLATDEIEL